MFKIKSILLILGLILAVSFVSAREYNFVNEIDIKAYECREYGNPTQPPYPINNCDILNDKTSHNGLDYDDNNYLSASDWSGVGYYHYFLLKNAGDTNSVYNFIINYISHNSNYIHSEYEYFFIRDFRNNRWVQLQRNLVNPNSESTFSISLRDDLANYTLNNEILLATTDNKPSYANIDSDWFRANLINCPSGNTTLFNNLQAIGDFENNGDEFILSATVRNIGLNPTSNATLELNNIPNGWVLNKPKFQRLGILEINEEKIINFNVVRDSEDAEVFTLARSCNAIPTSSQHIPIPINWIVVVLFSAVIIGLGIHQYFKR